MGMKSIKIICIFLGLMALPALSQQNTQNQSSTDIQSIQTRSYNKPYRLVYRSVLSVLFDNKFRISYTDLNSGVIVASGTPAASENMSRNTALIPFVGAIIASQRETEVEQWQFAAQIEEMAEGKEVQVRISINSQKRRAGMMVSAADAISVSDLIDKPEIYQGFFVNIEKAIFIRENIK